MAQAKTPRGSTNHFYLDSNQIPTAITFPQEEGAKNRMMPMVDTFVIDNAAAASADPTGAFVARENGRIAGIKLANGATALDGTNGFELQITNVSDSDTVLAYVGFGSGTEAAKATDKDVAVAADEVAYLVNTVDETFSKGDLLLATGDRDGTAATGAFEVIIEYGVTGR